MIFRLEYCNKESVTARVDIQKGGATPIYTVEGTAEPFVLFYNNDKGDKSGSFRSSGADINIYETAEFNIDELKTSNETEISVKYYINNILNWSGFVIPDFFSETITGGKGVVSMVASDRLGTLKGATLSGLSAKVSNRSLVDACLAQTGLSLPLYTMADFTGDGTNIFNSEVLSQRMVDTKGRNVSCYDILSSILEETNSLIVQRNGAWYIVNKLQLEAGSGSLYSTPTTSSAWTDNTVRFDEVSVGARRTIKPVAATVGVYHEHGGGRLHPDNYDFSLGVTGWTSVNGFVATTDNREIELYSNGTPIYGDATSNDYLVNNNDRVAGTLTLDTAPYLESASIPVVSTQSDMVDISIDVSITAPGGGSSSATPSFVRYAVIASNGTQTYALNRSGTFEVYDPTNLDHSQTIFIGSDVWGQIVAVSKPQLINGKLEVDLTGFNVKVRIYGSGTYQTTAIHFASIRFSNTAELPKGNMFKTTQGANYTKDHEIPTVLWGDYLTSGLNGYFYDYPIDDTSSLYLPTGELHSGWTAYGDPDTLPLLQHITRQKSRMFSVAHDLLSADITASTFDPLSIFVDCNAEPKRYVVVSARFDFLRSNVSVELEEVAYATNSKRDYIYSYFGDGEEGIRSIGGISGGSGGGGSTGGGLTSEQIEILSFWKKDPDNPNTIFTEMNAYSKLELSAYGVGDGGGGGGSDYERLDVWADYDSSRAEWVLSAFLGNDLNTRVTNLENSAGSGSVTSVGISVPTGLSVSNSPITSSGVIAIGLQAGYSIPTTVKQGQWDTAYSWGNHASAGYALNSALSGYVPTSRTITAGNGLSGGGGLDANRTITLGTPSTLSNSTTNSVTATSHTHQITGFLPHSIGRGSEDLDAWRTSGVYATGDSTTNKPSGSYTFSAILIAQSSTDRWTQLYMDSYSGGVDRLRYRAGSNTTWGAWKTVAYLDDNVASATTATNLSRSILAGSGLTGGGVLNADRTITLGTPSNITLSSTNSVGTSNHTHNFTLGGTASQYLNGATTLVTIPTITAGNGLSGGGQLTASRTLTLGTPGTLTAATTNGVTASSHTHAITTTSVGAANTIIQTDATGGTKLNNLMVGGAWKLEQVGTELQLKYNNVVAQRFLLDGSIVGLGEITAYGASTGGEGVSLLRTGGTMTGAIRWEAQNSKTPFIGHSTSDGTFTIAIDGTTWQSGLSLGGGSGDLLWKGSQVLDKANTANKIEMGNGWTIEQTTSALTIKKNGVVKGTFNA